MAKPDCCTSQATSNAWRETIRFLAGNADVAKDMGLAGWDLVRRDHTPEGHYETLMGVYERLLAGKSRKSQRKAFQSEPAQGYQPRLRVAFIGGRGVISKYS